MAEIRALAEDDFATFSVLVHLARVTHDGNATIASRVSDDGEIEYAAGTPQGDVTDPLLKITVEEAHAIYDALGVVLNRSHPHADQGRADLLHERSRVDKMLDVLADVARSR